ncbi:MAG: hypothetical protein WC781_01210 [Candidatus Pacearchaeota archaeon]|jgi:hypothetical protein
MAEQIQMARVVGTLREVLRKRLEDRILEVIDDHEEMSLDFEDVENIAYENNFTDIIAGIDEIDRQNGKIQRIREFERERNKQIRSEEKEFEEYLISHPEEFNKFEEGLNVMDNQQVVRSGRLDIVARDKEGKKAKIELKSRNQAARHYHFQIMKYFNDNPEGDERVIFLSKLDDPGLKTIAFSLDDFRKQGRIKFFGYTQSNGGYNYLEITPDNIENPKPIDWGKAKRKKDTDKIRVVRRAVRQPVRREEDKTPEEIEWDKAPLFYKVLLFIKPDLKNKERFLQSIEVTKKQKSELENLVCSDKFSSQLIALKEYSDILNGRFNNRFLSARVHKIIGFNLTNKASKQENKYRDNYNSLRKGFYEFLITLDSSKELPIEELKEITKKVNTLTGKVRYSDEHIVKYRQSLREVINTYSGLEKEIAHYLFIHTCLPDLYLFNLFIKSKLERTKKLAEIDLDLAKIYLKFNLGTIAALNDINSIDEKDRNNLEVIRNFGKDKPILVDEYYLGVCNFVINDNLLYKNIIDNLTISKINGFTNGERIPAGRTFHPAVKIEKPIVSGPTAYQKLEQAIHINGHRDLLTKDSKLRMNYFVEDVKNAGVNEDYVKSIGESFNGFNLAKKLRKRESVPSEISVRNFFDDVYLNYVLNNKVPSPEDLNSLYQKDCAVEEAK